MNAYLKKKFLYIMMFGVGIACMPRLQASLLFQYEGPAPTIVPGQGQNGFNQVNFTFTLENTGSVGITQLNATIFTGLNFSAVALAQTPTVFANLAYAGGAITATGGTLAPTAKVTIIATFIVPCTVHSRQYIIQGIALGSAGTEPVQTSFPPSVGTIKDPVTLDSVLPTIELNCNDTFSQGLLVNFNGGTPPYVVIAVDLDTHVSIIRETFTSPLLIQDLVTGHRYTVQVTDANGCQTAVSAGISTPVASTPALCPGAHNGTVSFAVAGGSGTYTVAIKGETTGFSPEPLIGSALSPFVFTGVPADTYNLTITDPSLPSCSITIPAAVTVGANGLTVTATALAPTCYGGNNGTITVSVFSNAVAGGSATVTVTPTFISAPTCPQATVTTQAPLDGTPITLQGFQGGTYEVSAALEDCLVSTSVTVPAQPELIVNSITFTNQTCPVIDDGTITITVSGNGPFTFTLCNSLGENCITAPSATSTFTFTSLAPGSYQIYATDKNGCNSETYPITIAAAVPINATAVGFAPTCAGGSDGLIAITATGGTGTLSYSLLTPPIGPQESNIITGLPAGTYSATVTDQNGCVFTLSDITVPDTAPISITFAVTPISCTGAHDATITITSANGGTQPLLFTLDKGIAAQQQGPQNGMVFTGVGPGPHTLLVTDANTPPCTITVTTPIISDPSPVSVAAVTIPALCFGQANGKVFVEGTGGTPPYQFSIDGGAIFGSQTEFDRLEAGTYSVIVKDSRGCTATTTATVIQPSPLAFGSITKTNVSCFLGSDGQIAVTGSGGAGGYTFAIDGGSFSSKNTFTGLTSGLHTIVVKDMNGCTAKGTVTLTQPCQLIAFAIATQPSGGPCFAMGAVAVLAQGGTMPYLYSINGGPFQRSNVFTQLARGSYTITVQDANGCIATTQVQVR